MEGLRGLAGNREAILRLGAAVGAAAGAEKLVARYDAVLADLAQRLRGATRPRVLYWASGMTAGGDTAIGSLIESAGARNVGAEIGVMGIGPVGAERAFVADPDVVLIGRVAGRAREPRASIPCSRACARCAKAASSRCRRSCWSP